MHHYWIHAHEVGPDPAAALASAEKLPALADLKYQDTKLTEDAKHSDEVMTIKFRYKAPDGDKSKLIVKTLKDGDRTLEDTSDNFRFSAAVAEYGLLLKDSEFKADASWSQVVALARKAKGEDRFGYRAEFIRLAETCKLLAAQ